ncbi:hypothetical protein L226DRAFT_614527 [Lentinus tigrinus ALCF2SS1-7]|nr:hypothetical protein L226DRAFT_614527 [Lentinus tigrinus ALCF2SS1-7]
MLLLNHALFAISVFVAHVAAHGVVISFTANGKTYTGEPNPDQPTGAASPIRAVANNGPVVDVSDKNMACGASTKVATMDVPVDAGSVVSVQWTKPWPHQWGPIITYLASCGEPCSKITDPTNLTWFKIDQLGASNTSDTTWVQGTLLFKSQPVQLTIPDKLKPGYYMIRHEIIALHNAMNKGGAEFYPQCIQIEVKGNTGNLVPSSGDMVHFPGEYQANDPGILVDVFTPKSNEPTYNVKKDYQFPGGPIPKLNPDSGDAGSSAAPSASSSSISTTSLRTTSSSSTGVIPSESASQVTATSILSTSTAQTPPTASVSGTCHAKRGSIKRRLESVS